MDKEDVVYIYNGILLSDQKELNVAIFNNVVETGMHYAKQIKSVREIQISYDFTPMWNLRNKTNEYMGRKKKTGKQTMRLFLVLYF